MKDTSLKEERRIARNYGRNRSRTERELIQELANRHKVPEEALWMAYYFGTLAADLIRVQERMRDPLLTPKGLPDA